MSAEGRVLLPAAQAGWEVVDDAGRVLASAATGAEAPTDLAQLCAILQAVLGPVRIAGHELNTHGVTVSYAEGCLVSRVHYRDGTASAADGSARVRSVWEDVELPQVYAEEHRDDLA